MKLLLGDCVEKMRELPIESVDAVVTDPPYEINFMNRPWDSAGVAFTAVTWREVLRSLKPGGHLLAFGAPRTYHRMVCKIEDAGFEIRDCLMWLYGSGFPKSHNLAGGLGTALKPAWEPIVLARKPIEGTVESNVTSYGTGALNIDASRVAGETPSVDRREHAAPGESVGSTGWVTPARPPAYNEQREGEQLGRWPANLILTHTSECVQTGTTMAPGRNMNRYTDGVKPFGGGVGHPHDSTTLPDEEILVWECHPDCPVRIMDEQSGDSLSTGGNIGKSDGDIYNGGWSGRVKGDPGYGDFGGASRFFYCAKVGQAERNAGTENNHPTVKPIDLMRYLVRLVTPVDGIVLDPFMGSGTTAIAAHLEGFKFVGIEQDKEYMKIAKARIKYWQEHGENALVQVVAEREREKIRDTGQLTLTDML